MSLLHLDEAVAHKWADQTTLASFFELVLPNLVFSTRIHKAKDAQGRIYLLRRLQRASYWRASHALRQVDHGDYRFCASIAGLMQQLESYWHITKSRHVEIDSLTSQAWTWHMKDAESRYFQEHASCWIMLTTPSDVGQSGKNPPPDSLELDHVAPELSEMRVRGLSIEPQAEGGSTVRVALWALEDMISWRPGRCTTTLEVSQRFPQDLSVHFRNAPCNESTMFLKPEFGEDGKIRFQGKYRRGPIAESAASREAQSRGAIENCVRRARVGESGRSRLSKPSYQETQS
ncbi:hypothetical protein EK21DRAFT_89747 [Setomelanomma holmii]|uniref:Uncharacterized protein n=1 Tax=Setomelanomma holmii TaxID=210430 RepID=A0A9P4LJR8_9PLEO|nr:hypothetical protein EK21DRAFT_89747 [Setomelanomma holmii]